MQGTTVRRWLIIFFLMTTAVHGVWSKGARNLHPQLHKLYKSTNILTKSNYLMGTWSPWSIWTPCSRTCGRGLTIQSRKCETDQKFTNRVDLTDGNGMKNSRMSSTCVGLYKRYQFCNTKECPGGSTDYRVEQCSAYNRRAFRGRYYQWEPFLQGPKSCELNCRPRGQRFYVTVSQVVIDGTSCSNSMDDICIGGVCKHVGCDGVIGSDKEWDHCGVCGGDHSTCRIVSGLYTMPQLPYGYNLVATIPRGACSVNITELKPSRNYLALRYLNGSYILNGNWAINWSGSYEAVGTTFDYRRDDDSPVSLELLTAKGPTTESIDMMVLSQHTNPGIKYEYTLPLRDNQLLNPPLPLAPPLISFTGTEEESRIGQSEGIEWRSESGVNHSPIVSKGPRHHHARHHKRRNYPKKHHNYHEASKKNNNGVTDVSKKDEAMLLSDVASASHVFSSLNRQRHLRPSLSGNTLNPFASDNFTAMPEHFTWRVTGFTECSRSCGGGVQKSIVVCMKDHSVTTVADHKCKLSDRPISQSLRCNTRPCQPEWVASKWSECSVTCGNGSQSQDFGCKQTISSALQISVADGMCSSPRPELAVRTCTMGPCYRWMGGEWGPCSVTCVKGVRRRDIKCVDALGKSVPLINCESDKKITSEEGCDMGPCSNTWYFSEWSSQCFANCGTGTQTRKIHCNADLVLYSKQSCEPNKKPEQGRSCISDKSCSQQKWFAGPWQQCSSSCGAGIRKRDLLCVSIVRGQHKIISNAMCEPTEKPSIEEGCNLQPCKSEWYMSEWSKCSQPCISAFQTRSVKCLDKSQKPSNDCEESNRPAARQNCDVAKCTAGEGQGDSECVDQYHSCRLVVQSRLCRYRYYRSMCCDSCYGRHR